MANSNSVQTISQIQNQIIANIQANPVLASLNNPSTTALWNLFSFIMATAVWVGNTVNLLFQTQTEAAIALAPAWTEGWLQEQAFLFQYSSSVPQVLSLNSNFVPSYAIPNTALQIISRCSCTTLPNNQVSVKVATSNPPQALTTQQLQSFTGFLNIIGPAGISFVPTSAAADQCMAQISIWYDGQYSSVIQTSVINAINNYFASIPFNGVIVLSLLEQAILQTTGVEDVEFQNIAVRANSVPLSSATYLVNNYTEVYRNYPLLSGYVIGETTTNFTLANTLTFIIQ